MLADCLPPPPSPVSSATLLRNLYDPEGIDWAMGTLFVATTGKGTARRGNCVLRVDDVDAKVGGTYDASRAATKRAALSDELWAWAAPHLSPRYEALRRR